MDETHKTSFLQSRKLGEWSFCPLNTCLGALNVGMLAFCGLHLEQNILIMYIGVQQEKFPCQRNVNKYCPNFFNLIYHYINIF